MRLPKSLTASAIAMGLCLTFGIPGIAIGQNYGDNYFDTDPDYRGYNDDEYDWLYYEGEYRDSETPDYFYDWMAWDDDYILTDPQLRAQIRRDLAISPFVDGERIDVSVNDGVATLSGRVEDRSAMIDAVEIAYDAGARKVRNRLRPVSMNDRPWMDLSDRELKEEIRDELSSSPFVNADRISVNVRNGVATLRGQVENRGEIADAVENAYEAGAKRVRSRLSATSDYGDFNRRTYSP